MYLGLGHVQFLENGRNQSHAHAYIDSGCQTRRQDSPAPTGHGKRVHAPRILVHSGVAQASGTNIFQTATNVNAELFGTVGGNGPEVYLTSLTSNAWLNVASLFFFASQILTRGVYALTHPDMSVGNPEYLIPETVLYGLLGLLNIAQSYVAPTNFLNYCLVTSVEDLKMDWAIEQSIEGWDDSKVGLERLILPQPHELKRISQALPIRIQRIFVAQADDEVVPAGTEHVLAFRTYMQRRVCEHNTSVIAASQRAPVSVLTAAQVRPWLDHDPAVLPTALGGTCSPTGQRG